MSDEIYSSVRALKLMPMSDSTAMRRFHDAAVRAGDELDDALRGLPERQQTPEVIDAVVAADEALRRLRAAIVEEALRSGEVQWR